MPPTLNIRSPKGQDGLEIWTLVQSCPPLDLNTQYAYMALGHYFSDTCAVVESEGKIVAFTSGFLTPKDPQSLFIWQVAVSPDFRKQGLGKKMVRTILQNPKLKTVRYLEATVGPSNQASRNLFLSLAREFNGELTESVLFPKESFAGAQHEDEILLRVGPIDPKEVKTNE